MPITLKQVAKLAGVSLATASRVLNGHPNVSSPVRERVLQVMQQQDYKPNPVARSLASSRGQKES